MEALPPQNAVKTQSDDIAAISCRVDEIRGKRAVGPASSNAVLKLAARVKVAQENYKNADADAAKAEKDVAVAISEVESLIGSVTEGPHSIAHFWRAFCQEARDDFHWAQDKEAKVRACFEQQLNLMKQMQAWGAEMEAKGRSVPILSELAPAMERVRELRDRIFERWPLTQAEFAYHFPLDVEEVVYIGPREFFRSAWTILWSVFRHPFETTLVDLSTGNCINAIDLER